MDSLPASLPRAPGYAELLGVPSALLEQLGRLRASALGGEVSLAGWVEAHAEMLAGRGPESAELGRLVTRLRAVINEVSDDFDRFMFLSALLADLRLLQVPNPGRERQALADALPTVMGAQRAAVERQLGILKAMSTTGREHETVYEPTARMFKALQVGTLEEIYRWLQAAVATNPGASVQDLLTQAAVEAAEAKLDLDRYDDLEAGNRA